MSSSLEAYGQAIERDFLTDEFAQPMSADERSLYASAGFRWMLVGWFVTALGVYLGSAGVEAIRWLVVESGRIPLLGPTLAGMTPIVAGGIGVAFSAVGLYRIHFAYFDSMVKTKEWRSLLGAIGSLVYMLGGVVVVVSARAEFGYLVLAGMWISAYGLAIVGAVIRVSLRVEPDDLDARMIWWWFAAGAFVAVAGASLLLRFAHTNWAFVAGLLLILVGLTSVNLSLMAAAQLDPGRWSRIGLSMVVGGSMMVVVALWQGWSSGLVALGVLLAVLGLSPLTKSTPKVMANDARFAYASAFVVGAGLAAILTVTSTQADWPWSLAVVVVVFGLVIAAALTSDLVELVVLLLVGAVLATVSVDRTDYAAVQPNPDADEIVIALGDSYMSGEGSATFFPQTNVAGQNECRRTSKSHVYRAVSDIGLGLDFLACSGAVTANLIADGQYPQTEGITGWRAQIAEISMEGKQIAAVVVSIGGNDAWFGAVGQACAAPGSCAIHRDMLLRRVGMIGGDLEDVYKRVLAAVDGRAPVIAVAYPMVLAPSGCSGSPLSLDEHAFLYEFIGVLNDQVRVAADRVGVHFFGGSRDAFVGTRICDDDEGHSVNVVSFNPKEGSLFSRFAPLNWGHGTFHPTERGYERWADVFGPWLEELIDQTRPARDLPKDEIGDRINPTPKSDLTFSFVASPERTYVSVDLLDIAEDLSCAESGLPVSARVRSLPLIVAIRTDNIEPNSTICYTTPNGEWASDMSADANGYAELPTWDKAALGQAIGAGQDSQIIIAKDSLGAWQVAVYRYCELDPDCAVDAKELQAWAVSQVTASAKASVVPVLLVLLAAWFGAVELLRRSRLRG